jgi:predicted membrane channel-forming protein YqfA (hemolysin III family)
MKLTPPKMITFWISVALALLGLLSQLGIFTLLPIAAFWLLFLGFVLLVLALLVKGL